MNNINYLFIVVFFSQLFYQDCKAQVSLNQNLNSPERGDCRIMFYNVENLFDCKDDPKTNDNEFLPGSRLNWTEYRFWNKLDNLFKVVAATGESEPPEIVAFAEIENRYVINQLIFNTPLSKYKYEIVHQESPDQRGIDVALIYRPDKIVKISEKFFRIKYSPETSRTTRDILYFSFRINKKDTIHLFVNHWPSRSGGQQASEKYRMFVASVLKSKTDSLFTINPKAKIIITGDFNDEPGNKSLKAVLRALKPNGFYHDMQLYNISYLNGNDFNTGTHKYQGKWTLLDQFIVSGSMLNQSGTYVLADAFNIFNPAFLLEPDEKFLGVKPKRTYSGFRYLGGFSDHLPVYIDLFFSH